MFCDIFLCVFTFDRWPDPLQPRQIWTTLFQGTQFGQHLHIFQSMINHTMFSLVFLSMSHFFKIHQQVWLKPRGYGSKQIVNSYCCSLLKIVWYWSYLPMAFVLAHGNTVTDPLARTAAALQLLSGGYRQKPCAEHRQEPPPHGWPMSLQIGSRLK